MKVAATSEKVTNSVCQIDDWPSTARTNTIWQTTPTDSRISPAANDAEGPRQRVHRRHPAGQRRGAIYLTLSALSISSLPPGTFSAKFLYEVFCATARQASNSASLRVTTSILLALKVSTILSSSFFDSASK